MSDAVLGLHIKPNLKRVSQAGQQRYARYLAEIEERLRRANGQSVEATK